MDGVEPVIEDPRLAEVIAHMSATGWAVSLCDSEQRLVWVSDELKSLLGEPAPEELGYGKHILECWWTGVWREVATHESEVEAFVQAAPWILYDSPEWRGRIAEIAPELVPLLEGVEPSPPPPVWTSRLMHLQGDLPPVPVEQVVVRVCDVEGNRVGHLAIYGSALPARVLALVARGDPGMYQRMARLAEPGRRRASILFADLQMSSALSRRLPSASYFGLMRALTTAVDDVVVRHKGIVGKHAGDGVTAFFLSDDLGSDSAAVRAAIEAARDIAVAARDAAKMVGEDTALIDEADCLINVGVHWGGHLFMGQLVTGGRLEVTALGDRVNECARIQHAARDGSILASKSLIEHLEENDASALGIDPDGVLYTPVADVPGAPDKSIRDAGGIPVTKL